jgi:hypothetical protein
MSYGTVSGKAMTVGSVPVATGANDLDQDNANLFYDITNHRLGLGTATPGTTLHVAGATTLGGAVTQKAAVVSGQGATATLTAAESGSIVLFDRAAGIVYTLPAPAVGLYYDFFVTTTITSNNAKIITDAGTTLLIGTISSVVAAGTTTAYLGNGTTHIAVTMNGTTTGGVQGTWLRCICVSATLWAVEGFNQASGSVATPFATS